MNIKIGAIIKKLRSENNITQDTLANAVGVTPQAISRWESGGGYPDIELLPALADFFAVSCDELIGYRLSEREEELAKIKKEMCRLSEVGTVDERIAFARNAMSRYPMDREIKENLAVCLYFRWTENKEEALFSEIESLYSSVIAECRDDDTGYSAINNLITIYGETGQHEKAMSAVNMLAPMKYCREFAKSCGIGDGNTEFYIQEEIDKLTDCLGIAIRNYPLAEELPNTPDTWDKKLRMIEISTELYKMIYGEDLMFYHVRLSFNYWLMSTYQAAQNKREETLCSLEKMCYHAVEYDKSYMNDRGKYYTSILTDKLTYPEPNKDFHELTEHSDCYYRLDRLSNARYDFIREDSRFEAVLEKLKEYAR